ncbi:SRPBCC family protein [Nocardia rhamnosiphila]
MQLVNAFVVDAPVDIAWAALTDIPLVAGCIPGAQIDERDGDIYHGRATIKVGPVGLTLLGTATVIGQDEDNHTMALKGSARDRNGQGSAEVAITIAVCDENGRAAVTVTTELDLGGRIGQFGSGMISQVSRRIIKQFVDRLNTTIATGAAGGTESPATSGNPTRPKPGRDAVQGRESLIEWVATSLAGVALGFAVGRMAYHRR